MRAPDLTGSHQEVIKSFSFFCLPRLPHVLHRGSCEDIEALAPETAGPTYGVDRSVRHYGKLTVTCIGESVLLGTDRKGQTGQHTDKYPLISFHTHIDY